MKLVKAKYLNLFLIIIVVIERKQQFSTSLFASDDTRNYESAAITYGIMSTPALDNTENKEYTCYNTGN